jgi:hypothetical protein
MEMGIGFDLGSLAEAKIKIAIGSAKNVSQDVLRARLRKMNAYAIARYLRAFLVSAISPPGAQEPFSGFLR